MIKYITWKVQLKSTIAELIALQNFANSRRSFLGFNAMIRFTKRQFIVWVCFLNRTILTQKNANNKQAQEEKYLGIVVRPDCVHPQSHCFIGQILQQIHVTNSSYIKANHSNPSDTYRMSIIISIYKYQHQSNKCKINRTRVHDKSIYIISISSTNCFSISGNDNKNKRKRLVTTTTSHVNL